MLDPPRAGHDAPAFLFDCYPHPGRSSLLVWILWGEQVLRREVPYQPDFCIRAEERPLEEAERLLAQDNRVEATWRDTCRLWLEEGAEEVLRVRPKSLHEMHAVAQDLRRRTHCTGFLFFDVDHQPESRWTWEQGLWMMCRLHVGPEGPELRLHANEQVLTDGQNGRWRVDHDVAPLRITRIEVRGRTQGFERSLDDPLDEIELSGHGGHTVLRTHDAVRAITGNTEAEPGVQAAAERMILRALGDHLVRHDPDVLMTRGGDAWDLPFLLHRIHALELQHTVRLGRDPDPKPSNPDQQGKSMSTYGRILWKSSAWYLRGRWHIDLSKKSLDAQEDRVDLWSILYMSRVSNRRAQDINRNGAGYALQQMQIDEARARGVALPWKRNLAEDWKDAATLTAVDRGGQIMVPKPGLYGDVAACDFSGYYPAIVVRHNLSSDTINCACCPDGPLIPELNYHVCTKRKGHQASILERVQGHRRWAKAILRRAKRDGQA